MSRSLLRFALSLLLIVGFQAHAENYNAQDEGDARAVCEQSKAGIASKYPAFCERNEQARAFFCKGTGAGAGYSCDGLLQFFPNPKPSPVYGAHYWPAGKECSKRELHDDWRHDGNPSTEDKVCDKGCLFELWLELDPTGSFHYYAPSGATCTVADAPPPQPCVNGLCEPDADGDGHPDSLDAFPTNPKEWKDTDGDGIGDNGDIAPTDPNNGSDGTKPPNAPPTPPGDGPGDETDNVSAGGGTCSDAPTCSGDGIQCNILYQTWMTRCAAERTATNTADGGGGPGEGPGHGTVTGGADCASSFVCTGGDPVACAALNEQHKARCDWQKTIPGSDDYGPEHPRGDAWGAGDVDLSDQLDDGGFLSNRSCPADQLQVGGDIVDWSPLCDGARVLAFYVMFLAWLHSARILGRAVTGGE